MNHQPSILIILIIDYLAFVAALFPLVTWCFYLIMLFLGEITFTELLLPIVFGVITVAALVVIAWRIQMINTIFSDGIEAQATISSINFYRDRSRVDYVYTYQNQKYSCVNAVHKVSQTRTLYIGQSVTVLVDRNDPKKAIIRDLYL